MTQTPEVLIRRQIGDLWSRGKLDTVDEIYAAGVVDHMPVPGQATGHAALKAVVASFRAALTDLRIDVHRILACGDRAADLWTLEATHSGSVLGEPVSGRRVRFSGIDLIRSDAGLIQEFWHVEELAHFAAQAQGAPSPPMPLPGASDGVLTDPDAVESIARTHIVELWGRARVDLVQDLYAPNVIDHMPGPGQLPGREGLVEALWHLRRSLPDLRLELHDLLVDEGFALDRWTITATHTGEPLFGCPARGRRVTFGGMDIIRVGADGLITDVWHVEEFFQLRRQLSL